MEVKESGEVDVKPRWLIRVMSQRKVHFCDCDRRLSIGKKTVFAQLPLLHAEHLAAIPVLPNSIYPHLV